MWAVVSEATVSITRRCDISVILMRYRGDGVDYFARSHQRRSLGRRAFSTAPFVQRQSRKPQYSLQAARISRHTLPRYRC
jgi:hypothetical protein